MISYGLFFFIKTLIESLTIVLSYLILKKCFHIMAIVSIEHDFQHISVLGLERRVQSGNVARS
jgi:hypothetical protein